MMFEAVLREDRLSDLDDQPANHQECRRRLHDAVEAGQHPLFGNVFWRRTRAYSLGINGAYINVRGRDAEGALEMAREGVDVAPGSWLIMTFLQTLMANDLHDEAHGVIIDEIHFEGIAQVFNVMVAAHRGDPDRLADVCGAAALDQSRRLLSNGVGARIVHRPSSRTIVGTTS